MQRTKLLLLYPVGALVANERSKLWLKICDADVERSTFETFWHRLDVARYETEPAIADGFFGGIDVELELVAPASPGNYLLEVFATDKLRPDAHALASLRISVQVRGGVVTAAAFAADIMPLSYAWGTDRGMPAHRLHLERFLATHASDIRGRCLEFQEPRYAPRFGGAAVERLDILHLDNSNPNATIVADITTPNDIPDRTFDCIICTHVLHCIYHLERAVAELPRILTSRGVLLIAVPQISMCDRRFEELWRFTPAGLGRLLGTAFAPDEISIRSYGNSYTSAGELWGMVASEFPEELLDWHDERFAAEICARAQRLG